MGDADIARGIVIGNQANEMEEAIEDLQDNLHTLQLNLQEFELRTLQQLQDHMRDHMRVYFTFRCFVIAINFIFIPIVMAVGFTCILKNIIESEAQDELQGIIQILWMIAASLGAPLYLGSIWALYNLPEPERLVEEVSPEGFGMVDEFDLLGMLMRMPLRASLPPEDDVYEIAENEPTENGTNEPDGEAEEVDNETEGADVETEDADHVFEEGENETGETENAAEDSEDETVDASDRDQEIESESAEDEEAKYEREEVSFLPESQEPVTYGADLPAESHTVRESTTNKSSDLTGGSDDTDSENDIAPKIVVFQVEGRTLTPEITETVA